VKISAAFGLWVYWKVRPIWSIERSRRFMSTAPRPFFRTSGVTKFFESESFKRSSSTSRLAIGFRFMSESIAVSGLLIVSWMPRIVALTNPATALGEKRMKSGLAMITLP
jgi:hypothetical protein